MRKGRIIALKKLQAAKENRNLIKNEYEEIEVRILGLLGRLGGISHKIVKEDTDKLNKVVNEKVEFVDILTNKSSGLQFNVNLEGFGFQIQLNKILSKVIELSEHEADSDNKNVAWDLMNCKSHNVNIV